MLNVSLICAHRHQACCWQTWAHTCWLDREEARLSLKVSPHSGRQGLPLHRDENANETIFIIVGVVDADVPGMNQTEAAVWSVTALSVERRKQWAQHIQHRGLRCIGHYRSLSGILSSRNMCRRQEGLIHSSSDGSCRVTEKKGAVEVLKDGKRSGYQWNWMDSESRQAQLQICPFDKLYFQHSKSFHLSNPG